MAEAQERAALYDTVIQVTVGTLDHVLKYGPEGTADRLKAALGPLAKRIQDRIEAEEGPVKCTEPVLVLGAPSEPCRAILRPDGSCPNADWHIANTPRGYDDPAMWRSTS